jgi:YVTN family beta-propeller protein
MGKEKSMTTKSGQEKIHSRPRLSRLRLAATGILFLAAAALAATAMHPPKLPWAVPTAKVGNNPIGVAVDRATDTIYVANANDNTVSVIDGSRCKAEDATRCSPIATLTHVGPTPIWLTFDPTTNTLYVTDGLTRTGANGNTIAVLNGSTCNARNTSGCGQKPAAKVTVPGVFLNQDTGAIGLLALDPPNHTLYAGDAIDGPVSMVNTATCNALNASGCSQTPSTMANGDAIAIDYSNQSVYVTDAIDQTISVLNGKTCNATTQSDCSEFSVTPVPAGLFPLASAVDLTTHTLYVPLTALTGVLDYVAVIDGSACNAIDHSGCGETPRLVQVGSLAELVTIDPTTKSAYVLSTQSSTLSVISTATCNGRNQSGCPQRAPALAVGVNPVGMDINPKTHTLYTSSQDTRRVWVLDTSTCNGMDTSGCTMFASTTTVGVAPVGVADNPNTKSVYVANQLDNTVSVINEAACNQEHLAGCNRTWPTINVGNEPRFIGINKITSTIYVSNSVDNTLSVIDGATCNGQITSGCMEPQPTTPVGTVPQQVTVDETTDTIYVVNQDDNTVSVINGAVCNGTDTSGCNQSWPTVTVGASPQALAVNPSNDTVYVANRDDNTVSVIDTLHCNATDSSGCGQTPATIAVGAGPRSVGIVFATNTVFVGNRDDLTVSVIDGATCNGGDTTGCGQTPPAVLVGAFPGTGGIGNNILARGITIDSKKHIIYIPNIGDSDVATLDADTCRAGHVNDCHVKIVQKRMGGFPIVATVDEATETVYVANDDDGTVSVFPSSQ